MQSLHLLQVQYWEKDFSLESARLIIQRKCRNMAYLLKQYLPYRTKIYPDQAKIFQKAVSKILARHSEITKTRDRQQLFLTEGRASRSYWIGFSLLTRCPEGWKRIHPHAADPWNIALNIGYTMLANILRERLVTHNLSLEIGMIHSPQRNHEALLYDFQELFRQPLVDSALISLFSRSKVKGIENRHTVAALSKRLASPIKYQHHWLTPQTVIDREIENYILAIKGKKQFSPYFHSWAHWNK